MSNNIQKSNSNKQFGVSHKICYETVGIFFGNKQFGVPFYFRSNKHHLAKNTV